MSSQDNPHETNEWTSVFTFYTAIVSKGKHSWMMSSLRHTQWDDELKKCNSEFSKI